MQGWVSKLIFFNSFGKAIKDNFNFNVISYFSVSYDLIVYNLNRKKTSLTKSLITQRM